MGANRSYVDQRLPHLAKLLHGTDTVTQGAATIVVAHDTAAFRSVVAASATDTRVFDLVGLTTETTGARPTVGVAWPTTTS